MAAGQIRADSARVTYIAISYACRIHGIAPSRFGRRAVGDPQLVFDMQNGRCLRPKTEARVRQFLAGLEASDA
jgi:hypothetical protein